MTWQPGGPSGPVPPGGQWPAQPGGPGQQPGFGQQQGWPTPPPVPPQQPHQQQPPQFPPPQPQPAPAPMPSAPLPGAGGPQNGPVVIDIGSRDTRRVLIGGLVAALLGVPTLVMMVVSIPEARGDDWIGVVIGGVIGLMFTGIAVLALVNWKMVSRPRKLIFEAGGIRWDDPQGKPWAVAWPELAGVSISRTAERPVQLSDAVVRKVMVRLDLFPRDEGFRARHPEMEHLWEFHRVRNGYRLPLGDAGRLIPVLERGLVTFGPQVYRGIQDEGFSVGLV